MRAESIHNSIGRGLPRSRHAVRPGPDNGRRHQEVRFDMGADALFQPPPLMLASVIDLDLSFFIQLGLFLLLYVLLSRFFFQPYARILKVRDESTRGMREEAAELEARAAVLEQSTASRLEEARKAGNDERRRIAAEGSRIRAELIANERGRLQAVIDAQVRAIEDKAAAFNAASEPAVADLAATILRQAGWNGEQETR